MEPAVAYQAAFVLFAGPAAGCWFTSVALYRGTLAGHDPAAAPDYHATAALAVLFVAVASFIPFPLGYFAGLGAWAVAVFGWLKLSAARSLALLGYLAATSLAARLLVLGVMGFFGI
jgi:hypothetical protein